MKQEKEIPTQTPLVEFSGDKMNELVKSFTPDKLASFLDVTDLNADTQSPKLNKMVDLAKNFCCASVYTCPGIHHLHQCGADGCGSEHLDDES